MPKRRYLVLNASQRSELGRLLQRDPRPYMRERAAALLQIADGRAPCWVAQHGLLRTRKPDTVMSWLNAYQAWGAPALVQQPRRKRAFCPSAGG
jgi:hypothetical protein